MPFSSNPSPPPPNFLCVHNIKNMPFVHSYNGAMMVLKSIETGSCDGRCRTSWTKIFKNALKSAQNPLGLTPEQRKSLAAKLDSMKGKKKEDIARTNNKYANRPSPPFPANKNCGKTKKGNDGNLYKSVPNKNGVCAWRRV